MNQEERHFFEFGPFILDEIEGVLIRDGKPVHLTPKALKLLVVLVRNSNHIVHKDELMRQVWPDAIVEETNLAGNIHALRQVLCEGNNEERYIETIPKRGYRFVASVSEKHDEPAKLIVEDLSRSRVEIEHQHETCESDQRAEIALPAAVEALTTGNAAARATESGRAAEIRPTEKTTLLNRSVIIAVAALIIAAAAFGYFFYFARAAGAIDSLAVLPLANASNDPNVEYLCDGISEALINSLTELQQLRVTARSTAFRYKGKEVDPRAVGRELNVRAVLTGRVRQIGDALNIQVDLVDTATGAQLWGKEYERKVSDVLSAKQTIALEVTANLRLRLSGAEQQRLVKSDTTNAEAYQLYLKGRYFWNKKTEEGYKRGREYFEQAIDLDPAYAPAYTGVADTTLALGSYLIGLSTPREAWAGAETAAKQALSLDDTLGEAHASLAWMTTLYKWNWPEAEQEIKRAIELKPDYATAHHWYAHLLIYLGRKEEALSASQRGLELDPLDLTLNAHLGWHYLCVRQYDLALGQLRKTVEMDPNFSLAHWYLGLTYEQKGMFAEAIAEFQKLADLSKRSPTMLASLGHAYAVAGQPAEARKILFELHELSKQRYVLPYCFALIHAGLDEKDQAFAYLEKSYQERDSWLNHLKVEPRLDSLRSDPRFGDLLRRVGLPQ
jgi:DNA-binding winged helix-turn-helix (wHTH) protein/TolB-like protein/Flp pilus assembly protein TadD